MKKQFFAALTLVAALLGSVVAAIGADLAFPIHVTAIGSLRSVVSNC